ncbi:ferritin-like domain-containing protein [Actinacidiphila glaucinigra]|uniref:ferritin-like domain-containing protein n=1 Tax=Actinacidiphila glaucinigra TaxID=235986 RepID=UPI0035D67D71
MTASGFARWTERFEEERDRRRATGDPAWARGAVLHDAVRASVQRFQAGEDGDGAYLIAKADGAGDRDYAQAVRLFVAEEQNHARLLARLLDAAGASTIDGHWTDRAFVALRRLLGLRLELLVLMVAEEVALRYYRALREGADDPLTREVAGRILADEQRHVPFHCERLRASLAALPAPARRAATAGWRVAVAGAALLVAVDHGRALRVLGVGRARFVADAVVSSKAAASAMLREPAVPDRGAGEGTPTAPASRGPLVDSRASRWSLPGRASRRA